MPTARALRQRLGDGFLVSREGRVVPRYYFHLHDELEVGDEEGRELADIDAARAEAIRGARDLMAEDVRQGRLTLSHRIEVRDQGGTELLSVRYGDAVELRE